MYVRGCLRNYVRPCMDACEYIYIKPLAKSLFFVLRLSQIKTEKLKLFFLLFPQLIIKVCNILLHKKKCQLVSKTQFFVLFSVVKAFFYKLLHYTQWHKSRSLPELTNSKRPCNQIRGTLL